MRKGKAREERKQDPYCNDNNGWWQNNAPNTCNGAPGPQQPVAHPYRHVGDVDARQGLTKSKSIEEFAFLDPTFVQYNLTVQPAADSSTKTRKTDTAE